MKTMYRTIMLLGMIALAPLAQAVVRVDVLGDHCRVCGRNAVVQEEVTLNDMKNTLMAIASGFKASAAFVFNGAKKATSALVTMVKRYPRACGVALCAAIAAGASYKAYQLRKCFINPYFDGSENYSIAQLTEYARTHGDSRVAPFDPSRVNMPAVPAGKRGMVFDEMPGLVADMPALED